MSAGISAGCALEQLSNVIHYCYQPVVLESRRSHNADASPRNPSWIHTRRGDHRAVSQIGKSVLAADTHRHRLALGALDAPIKNLHDATLLLEHSEKRSHSLG